MPQTTFNFDRRTEQVIEALKVHFGATTKAEILRKALALLDLAREAEEEGRGVAILDEDGQPRRVILR